MASKKHIVDQLIAERTLHLSQNFFWPFVKPVLYRFLHYRQAVTMADHVAQLSGWDAMVHLSALLALNMDVRGAANIPTSGPFILAVSHPTGIADGVAIFDLLKTVRPDMAVFANRDALRVNPNFRGLVIPVEWRAGEKTRAKSRDTLSMTTQAFADGKAIILFPSGRIAYWHEGHLTERPWQTSIVALARRYDVPVVPVKLSARNSGLFYLLSRYSNELRDMTLFHELLNKTGQKFDVTVGRAIAASELQDGDPYELAALLQQFTVVTLAANPNAVFTRDQKL